ncbi:ribonuclease, Rne/Rng family [Octadecabacter temperatus]|uniref:Ribonuclease G n=1 Tax=Octadecabacter temperatus TaxID=1458307 RepID=A0A0K0Y1Z6_9RHOB|nr:ribonuclease E/G [Octadecabacter temperatus]AKS44955.1 Ribonuclease G [Octadecabacter temperatus]SIN83356.1 ribonuclease, Rne/Rng family [Octadecabacter temperatus]
MKGRMIVLDHVAGREAAALLVDGKLQDLMIDDDEAPRPGAIFRAICDRPLKGQGGMMLKLPEGETAFLRQGKGLAPGQAILVQVTGYADGGKAIPVTDRVLFKSRYAIVTPGKLGINVSRSIKDDDVRERVLACAHEEGVSEGFGLILRSSCEGGSDEDIIEDIAAMDAMANAIMADKDGVAEALTDGDGPHALAWREWVEPATIVTETGGFEDQGVLDQMATLSSPRVSLEASAFMYVEPTRALVAVDVNTGGDTSPASTLKANLAACKALPRALRLRGLGGQIVIDLAPMSKAHRKQIESTLRGAFREDTIDTALVGWTPLGHFELQRKRERLPTPLGLV